MIDSAFVSKYDLLIDNYIKHFNCRNCEDIKQDVYVKLISNRHRIDHKRNIKAYIYTIVKNVIFDNYRKDRKVTIKTTKSEPARIYYGDIVEKIDEINKGDSLKLHIRGYKYREIAQILGCSLTAVRSRIYRARLKLKKLI